MSLEEEQASTPEIVESTVEAEEKKTSVDGESTTPEETDEEKNTRVQAEAAAKATQREEKRQQSVQKRINELTAEKYSAQKLADQLAEQNARILALLEGKGSAKADQTKGEPTRDQFTDYEDFITARAEYRAEQKALAIVEKFSKTQEENTTKRTQEADEAKVQKDFLERRAAVEKSIPDFREVVEDWNPKLPDSVVETIIRMADGPLISYHLAKNPELEQQFRDSPAYMHGVLLGQLSATLKSPTKVTAAPAPGKPVAQKPGSSNEPPSNPELYYEWAKKHLK